MHTRRLLQYKYYVWSVKVTVSQSSERETAWGTSVDLLVVKCYNGGKSTSKNAIGSKRQSKVKPTLYPDVKTMSDGLETVGDSFYV